MRQCQTDRLVQTFTPQMSASAMWLFGDECGECRRPDESGTCLAKYGATTPRSVRSRVGCPPRSPGPGPVD